LKNQKKKMPFYSKTNPLRVFEMFSGYGGASFALKLAKIPYMCVGFSEIDKDAINCYQNNFPSVINFGDCTKIEPNQLPSFDLLTAGFPCQPFSEAGKHRGTNDTRGTLFYDILRIAKVKKPSFLVLENVKGLTFNNHKNTLSVILEELNSIGYVVNYRILNSRNFGTPQSRERVVFLCALKVLNFNLEFPKEVPLNRFLKDLVISGNYNDKLDFEKKWKPGFIRDSFPDKNLFSHSKDFIISVAVRNRNRAKHQHTGLPYGSYPVEHHLRFNKDYGVSFAVKSARHEYMICDMDLKNIRYLTPQECFRLMGFFNDEINLTGLSETALLKLVGNGWDVNLFMQVFQSLFKSCVSQ
jgi:DNA (cytosine-5)-methyltransferase 1